MEGIFYSVEQVSAMLQLHPKTVQRHIREGRLKATKLGKRWRVSGHDLSLFTEGPQPGTQEKTVDLPLRAVASSVVDIQAASQHDALRMMNNLTALSNGKPSGDASSSVHVQYIPGQDLVRISLWGSIPFMRVLMQAIEHLTERAS
jgi:excisionase family DNA binding protein